MDLEAEHIRKILQADAVTWVAGVLTIRKEGKVIVIKSRHGMLDIVGYKVIQQSLTSEDLAEL